MNRLPELQRSRSYKMGKQAKKYLDDYYLDGILGLMPVLGDVLSYAFHLLYLYIALFKLHSKRLACVILLNATQDLVIGLIPVLGTVLDFFYKANRKNFELIEKFASGDVPTIRAVNRQAGLAVLGVVLLLVCVYFLVKWTGILLMMLYHYFV